jgi:DNA-binding MarR family transcriptional regulator
MKAPSENVIREPIGRVMSTIARLFLADLHRKLRHLDIKRSFYPLVLIERGGGRMTQQELAQELSCDKVQVVRIIDYLSSNGYVRRERDSGDRRKFNLKVTDKALGVLPDIRKAFRETTEVALAGVPVHEVDDFLRLLRTLQVNLLNNQTTENNE